MGAVSLTTPRKDAVLIVVACTRGAHTPAVGHRDQMGRAVPIVANASARDGPSPALKDHDRANQLAHAHGAQQPRWSATSRRARALPYDVRDSVAPSVKRLDADKG